MSPLDLPGFPASIGDQATCPAVYRSIRVGPYRGVSYQPLVTINQRGSNGRAVRPADASPQAAGRADLHRPRRPPFRRTRAPPTPRQVGTPCSSSSRPIRCLHSSWPATRVRWGTSPPVASSTLDVDRRKALAPAKDTDREASALRLRLGVDRNAQTPGAETVFEEPPPRTHPHSTRRSACVKPSCDLGETASDRRISGAPCFRRDVRQRVRSEDWRSKSSFIVTHSRKASCSGCISRCCLMNQTSRR